MKTAWFFATLWLFALTACDTVSPFIDKTSWQQRLDIDGDGIPRPDDCDDRDPTVGTLTWYRDIDQDGAGAGTPQVVCEQPAGTVASNTDCDDTRAEVYPGAFEYCDHLDNDCNGKTDDNPVDPSPWYLDHDEDGYGLASEATFSCNPPVGFVANKTDCRDDVAAIHPLALETCNFLDDDCDGETDEGVKLLFFKDEDQDGYGLSTDSTLACDAPIGTTRTANDCDDTRATIHPNAPESCNLLDDNCDGETDELPATNATFWFQDVDQDGYGNKNVSALACTAPPGYVDNDTDCHDLSKPIHPNAAETCNLLDDNCDGETDEGTKLVFYQDKDQDGYGNKNVSALACTAPPGHVDNADDCQDDAKFIHPNQPDVCDNTLDDDCDGVTDNATAATIWYQDLDQDGYGTNTYSVYACTPPIGFSANAKDCDDKTSLVSPDAKELCADNIDNDCNGQTDTDAQVLLWYKDGDTDSFGDISQTISSCTQPNGYVLNALDCNDADSLIHPNTKEVCNNFVDDNCDKTPNQCVFDPLDSLEASDVTILGPQAMTQFGGTIALAGDLNADNIDDFLVGSPNDSTSVQNGGRVHVLHGPLTSGSFSPSPTSILLSGNIANQTVGSDMDGNCTLNQDAFADVVIGASGASGTASSVTVLFGNIAPPLLIQSATTSQFVGTSVRCVGDINNDGFDDLAIGATRFAVQSTQFGSVGLFFGPHTSGTISFAEADVMLVGLSDGERYGGSIAHKGDVNGDAIPDLLVGATNHTASTPQTGGAFLHYGPITTNAPPDKRFIGELTNDRAGHFVDILADHHNDGHADIVIGAYAQGSTGSGALYLFFTPPAASVVSLVQADLKLIGEGPTTQAGFSAASGDMNADGIPDLIVSAPEYGPSANGAKGRIYLFLGPLPNGVVSLSTADHTMTGQIGDTAGNTLLTHDVNHDFVTDLLIGARHQATNGLLSGGVYALFGKTF